jgi:hypothetical protein
MFCPGQKNDLLDFQNQRCIGIFMSQRERERKRESERKSESKREKEKERTKVQAIIFLNCPAKMKNP